jgi:hypothetical protein
MTNVIRKDIFSSKFGSLTPYVGKLNVLGQNQPDAVVFGFG